MAGDSFSTNHFAPAIAGDGHIAVNDTVNAIVNKLIDETLFAPALRAQKGAAATAFMTTAEDINQSLMPLKKSDPAAWNAIERGLTNALNSDQDLGQCLDAYVQQAGKSVDTNGNGKFAFCEVNSAVAEAENTGNLVGASIISILNLRRMELAPSNADKCYCDRVVFSRRDVEKFAHKTNVAVVTSAPFQQYYANVIQGEPDKPAPVAFKDMQNKLQEELKAKQDRLDALGAKLLFGERQSLAEMNRNEQEQDALKKELAFSRFVKRHLPDLMGEIEGGRGETGKSTKSHVYGSVLEPSDSGSDTSSTRLQSAGGKINNGNSEKEQSLDKLLTGSYGSANELQNELNSLKTK